MFEPKKVDYWTDGLSGSSKGWVIGENMNDRVFVGM